MEETLQICIRDINPHIVCSLCAGYYVDATTITECLHTFCKSCIVKYLQSSKHCPQCNVKIHETQPLSYLKPDRVMQDIVFKLVPSLYENEEKRRQEFYRSRGLTKEQKQDENMSVALRSVYDNPDGHLYRNDEQVSLCLERYSFMPCVGDADFQLGNLAKKFVRCSVRTCISHVIQLIRLKLNIPAVYDIEILCHEKVMQRDMCLKHVWLSQWYGKQSPLMLFYRIKSRSYLKEMGIVQAVC